MSQFNSIGEQAERSPRTTTERQIAAIWQDLFGLAAVPVDADFFALGGNSLTAIKFLSRLEGAFGTDVLLPDTLFETPCLKDLAAAVDATLQARA